MNFPNMGCLERGLLVIALGMFLALSGARAGGSGDSALDFARSFLEKYPRFRAEGVMTSTLVGKPPYHCRVEMVFDKKGGVLFSYNTDGSKNIIPYDYAYQDKTLREKVYNRDRSQILKNSEIGVPTRTVFNFVWNLLYEAEHGAGFNSLLANGLMSIDREEFSKGTRVILNRRIPTGPVEKVKFIFDDEQRLKLIEITQGDGSLHRIEIRKFRRDPWTQRPVTSCLIEIGPQKRAGKKLREGWGARVGLPGELPRFCP